MHGFGLMAGPFLGGLLYEIGGFYFPFAICGGILMLCAVLSALFLTNDTLAEVFYYANHGLSIITSKICQKNVDF